MVVLAAINTHAYPFVNIEQQREIKEKNQAQYKAIRPVFCIYMCISTFPAVRTDQRKDQLGVVYVCVASGLNELSRY